MMRKKLAYVGSTLLVAAALGIFGEYPPVWADGGGGGGGAGGDSSGGEGGVAVTYTFSPANRVAPGRSREIYIVQEDGAFKDLMHPKVSYPDGIDLKKFMPTKRLVGIYTALRSFHHPDSLTYTFTGRTMEGKEVVAEFPVIAEWVEGEVAFSGAGTNLVPVDEIHATYLSEPDEIEWEAGGSTSIAFKMSLLDAIGNPVSGQSLRVFVLLQDRIVVAGGTNTTLPAIETALGTYETAPVLFGSGGLPDGEYDVTIWVDFNGDATEERSELLTVTIEAEDE